MKRNELDEFFQGVKFDYENSTNISTKDKFDQIYVAKDADIGVFISIKNIGEKKVKIVLEKERNFKPETMKFINKNLH